MASSQFSASPTTNQESTPKHIGTVVDRVLPSSNAQQMPVSTAESSGLQDILRVRIALAPVATKTSPPTLLSLPAEIRNMIYRYCLIVGKVVHYRLRFQKQKRLLSPDELWKKPQTQLFQVCKTIFVEAAPIYFAETQFFLLSSGSWPWQRHVAFLRERPVSSMASANLKHLHISFDCWELKHEVLGLFYSHKDVTLLEKRTEADWKRQLNRIVRLPLDSLVVSIERCFGYRFNERLVMKAIKCILDNPPKPTKIIITGFKDEHLHADVWNYMLELGYGDKMDEEHDSYKSHHIIYNSE